LIACDVKINRATCKNIQSIEILRILNQNIKEKRLITSCVGFFDNNVLEFLGKKKLPELDISFVNGNELAQDAIVSNDIERLKIVLRYFPIYKIEGQEDLFSQALKTGNLEIMEIVVRFGKRNNDSTMTRNSQLALCDAYYKTKHRLCQQSVIASSRIRESLRQKNCSNSYDCFEMVKEEGLHEEYSKVIGLNEKKMKENTLNLINEINNSL
jgi:hypothetical protein